jgi:hypothetical protein
MGVISQLTRRSQSDYTVAPMNHETQQVSRWGNWSLPAVLALAAFSVRLLPGLRIVDDAYITYRYALNIAHGHGFVYNPGEFVLGTTTPLYTLLLAVTGWLTKSDSYPTISIVFNALADTVGVVLLYDLARRLFSHWLPATVIGLLWVVAPRSVTFAIGGMETSLFVTMDRKRVGPILSSVALGRRNFLHFYRCTMARICSFSVR